MPHPSAIMLHLDRTRKSLRALICNFKKRGLTSLASGVRRRVTIDAKIDL